MMYECQPLRYLSVRMPQELFWDLLPLVSIILDQIVEIPSIIEVVVKLDCVGLENYLMKAEDTVVLREDVMKYAGFDRPIFIGFGLVTISSLLNFADPQSLIRATFE